MTAISSIGDEGMFVAKNSASKVGMDTLTSKIKNAKKDAANSSDVDKTAEDFEAVFLTEMFNRMFSGIQTDKLFGGGNGEEMWKSFLNQEYAKIVSKCGGVGVADSVKQEMLRLQEENLK